MNISVKYALLMKIKHYSVLQTLLQDLVALTAFKKGGLLMFQLSATSVCSVAYC